jgi:hypothetical protein
MGIRLSFVMTVCILLAAADGTVVVSDPYGFSRPSGLETVSKGLAVVAVTE